MRCPRCEHENRLQAKFCEECGTPLTAANPGGTPAPSYAEITSALAESLEQQTATSEILRVISSSPDDVQPVLDAVAENAARVCGANEAQVFRIDGDTLCRVAAHGSLPEGSFSQGELSVPWIGECQEYKAQPAAKIARVGVLASSTEANFEPGVKVFREALSAAGWVEGRNLTLDVRYPGEQYARLPELATELVRLKVDVLASLGTPATLAAKRATTTIPIVTESLSDVVSTGLMPNVARPGGNLTGVSGFAPELSGKRLELIREIFPGANRIAVLANRANPATVHILRATEAAAQQIRMKLRVLDVRQPADLGVAFETMTREQTDALVLVADPLLFSERPLIIELAARRRLPAVYETRLFPEAGGLLSYGPLTRERFQRMAVYVDRLLRGASPGESPIEPPTKFELVINLKTAKVLGLTIPPSVLARADEVIE